MPIFDITLSTPLPSARTRLRAAAAGSATVGSRPAVNSSSTVSIARYGLIAPAPYPISSAAWCTSRQSPVSTTRPTLVRSRSRTRWWCTAAVSSSDGIGACRASLPRSVSSTIRAPPPIAATTSARTR